MNKEERTKRFKSMSSMQRQELIIKKMKERGIKVGSGIPNQKYDSKEIYGLIVAAKRYQKKLHDSKKPKIFIKLNIFKNKMI